MRIIIDIGHPAHVHYFKHLISYLQSNGHILLISARNKEMTQYLLNQLGINFIDRGRGKNSVFGKLLYLVKTDALLFNVSRKFKPDLFLGFGSFYVAQVAFLLKKPSIILDDTENAKFSQLFYKKFASSILSPSTFKPYFGDKHIKFESYMELCYLHPKHFKVDNSLLQSIGVEENDKYTVVRFVSWKAHHDFGHKGISIENKIRAVNEFSKYGKVFITSEKEIPIELEQFRLKINPEHIHHLLAKATLFYGESATMASESAVLGTPAIYLDNVGRGYTDEQESRYGLVFNYSESMEDQMKSINQGCEILSNDSIDYQSKRKKMLNEKIDLTSFLIWFINNYPKSMQIMKVTPEFQSKFK
ncbi:MAG: DUF354 domain-containing protein [Bacteroidales bacterium]|nr:DUF354 domain-containing protein [Bacteroidales bacterium]